MAMGEFDNTNFLTAKTQRRRKNATCTLRLSVFAVYNENVYQGDSKA